MARKLIDQDEAARILGVSAEEVGSLRDRKKLFPYRDGDQWKYKQDDVERLRDELQAEKSDSGLSWESSTADEATGDSEEIEIQMSDDLDSILLSEIELGKSGEGPSTIIGKADKGAVSEEDDFSIIGEEKPTGGQPDAGDMTLAGGSDLSVGGGSGLGIGSDVQLAATGSEIGKKPGSSDKLFGSDALKLSDDELSLVAPGGDQPKSPGDSSKKGAGSSIKLGDEDAESALGGSPGSDVGLSAADSGIQLISAADSGLSLDEPLALGSSAKKLLELSDEDVISLEESPGGETVTTGEKADDEFLLTAIDETAGEESDSGSQVIALDADEELSSGMFAPVAQTEMLEEEAGAAPELGTAAGASPLLGTAQATGAVAAVPEAPFSTANVAALVACVLLLTLCGMMAYDLMRNMWSWGGAYTVNSSILESIGNTIGWLGK